MNVFDELRELERAGERFDTIVLDPPAFAKNKASVRKALSGYKEINLRALKLLKPRRLSSSPAAARTTSARPSSPTCSRPRRSTPAPTSTVVEKRTQGRDHPILITVPETYYLKCFILRKL